jgi:hypothetical protein
MAKKKIFFQTQSFIQIFIQYSYMSERDRYIRREEEGKGGKEGKKEILVVFKARSEVF